MFVLQKCLIFGVWTKLYEIQSALVKDPAVSVNRVIWSPDGNLFGRPVPLSIIHES